jgi:hypothetical protein
LIFSTLSTLTKKPNAQYFWDPGKFSMVFSVVFQANTGKKLWGKITEKIAEKITGPANLMLNVNVFWATYPPLLDNVVCERPFEGHAAS